jgi:hypothetical protein
VIATLAGRQHGVVARQQLEALGFTVTAIKHRVACGRLHPLHRGVYAVGHASLAPRGWQLAAVLACGAGAMLSHRSAAALWGLLPTARRLVDVSSGRSRRGARGIALHRVRRLDPADRAEHDGIPVTSVARTLLDLAEVVPPRLLERAFEEAERLSLLDRTAIVATCDRGVGRRGVTALRALVTAHRPPAALVRSELERRFVELCRDADLPFPAMNVVVAGLEVDAVWPDQRLVVELDGHAFHRTAAAFERDRERDATLALAGFRVVRITYRRLHSEPATVAGIVRALPVS